MKRASSSGEKRLLSWAVPALALCLLPWLAAESLSQQDKANIIRPGQEGRFKALVGTPKSMTSKIIGELGGREVIEIDTPNRIGNMGKIMVEDGQGHIWYLETREDKVVKVDRETSAMTEYTLPRGSAPYSFSIDSNGVLWITAHGIEMLLEFDPAKGEVISHAPPSHGFLIHINVDRRDNTVYFCQPGANLIVSYHRQRGFREYRIPTFQAGPGRLDFDSKGYVWFPELYANKLAKLDPKSGRVEEWDLPTKDALPSYCRVDPTDTVWISLPMADKIASFKDGVFKEYQIPTSNSIVSTTVADNDGVIWFTEGGWRGSAGGNKVGRLEPKTGRVEELALPTPNAQPLGMIIDRQGVIWFQQSNAGKICRINPPKNANQAKK